MINNEGNLNSDASNKRQNHTIFEPKSFKNKIKKLYSLNNDFVQSFVKSSISCRNVLYCYNMIVKYQYVLYCYTMHGCQRKLKLDIEDT